MKNNNACGACTLYEILKRDLNDIQCTLGRIMGLDSSWERIIGLVIFLWIARKTFFFSFKWSRTVIWSVKNDFPNRKCFPGVDLNSFFKINKKTRLLTLTSKFDNWYLNAKNKVLKVLKSVYVRVELQDNWIVLSFKASNES